jgi:arginyl-tRNA synthetase
MKLELQDAIEMASKELFGVDIHVDLTRPDEQFGDYATNVALQLAGKLQKKPREVAEALAEYLRDKLKTQVSEITVAGPGFLNLRLQDAALWKLAETPTAKRFAGQKIVAEYSDPNPFKVLHAGHLYTSVVGDAMANLLEEAGAEVHRVNFGGDVGLHVGRAMWAILGRLDGEHPEKLQEVPEDKRAEWMAEAYVQGTSDYEDSEFAKQEIIKLNKRVYQLHTDNDHDSPFAQIYWTTRKWSYDYFDAFYKRIGSSFERYYPESAVSTIGLETVKGHIGQVFEESDGAIVFRGDKYGLHTRVFINSEGIPTYEAKDVGLIMQKWEDYRFDRSVVITGNEQLQYMEVVLKAVEQFAPALAQGTTHITHGMLKMKGGVKMSSRKGNVLKAVDVLDAAARANKALTGNEDEQVVLAAVKYAMLKQRVGGDIIYVPEESVAIEGNSGPYIQYAHARARSILNKSTFQGSTLKDLKEGNEPLEADERSLLRKVSEYAEVIEKATDELMPHHICSYLYELAQTFNRFYEKNRVLENPREAVRLQLVSDYADTLKSGLKLLSIEAPDKM